MLRPAPRTTYRPRSTAQKRRGVRVIQRAAAAPPRPRPVKRPTAVQRARAEQRYRVSQGKAVERQANRQRRAAKRRQLEAPSRYYVSLGESVEKQANRQRAASAKKRARSYLISEKRPVGRIGFTPVKKKETEQLAGLISKQGYDKAVKTFRVDKAERAAAKRAPLLWALKQVSRPLYGSAGGSLALVKGKSVGQALHQAKRGIQLKDQHTYNEVLSETGWKPKSRLGKLAKGTVAFGLDVALDPTTYLTFGTASVGEKALAKAAQRAAEDAARASAKSLAPKVAAGKISKSEAERIAKARGRTVGRQHMERGVKAGKAAGRRGVTVRVAGGKHVRKGIRKAGLESKRAPLAPLTRSTGQVGQAVRFLAPKGRKATQVRQVTRRGASQLHANVRPHDLSKTEQRLVKGIRREGRAEGEATARRVASRSNRLLGRLAEHEQRQVIDAIEADKIGRLKGQAEKLGAHKRRPVTALRSRKTRRDPDRLLNVAKQVRSDVRHLNRVGRRSGLLAGQVGKKGRTRVEAALSATAHATPRSARSVQAALPAALKERALARENVRRARLAVHEKPRSTRRGGVQTQTRTRASVSVQRAVQHAEAAEQRVENLRAALAARTEGHARAQAAKGELRRVRSERLKGEAKGYFPRTNEADIEERGFLARMAKGTEDPKAIPRAEQLGANQPRAGAAERRQYRKSRADLERGTKKERKVAESLTSDVRETLSKYGTSVSRASAARNLNTRLLQSGRKLPANMSEDAFDALKRSDESVYRVRRGVLEKVDDYAGIAQKAAQRHPGKGPAPLRSGRYPERQGPGKAATGQARAVGGGGQYAILKDSVVKHVRQRSATTDNVALQAFDKAQSTFKGVALATPGYLVRNVLGDAFNAAVHENPFKLARNVVKGQKALNALGRYEKANRIFEKQVPKNVKTIRLTKDQAAALGTTKTEIPAMHAALLAEKMGVIRQGRFLELIEEGGKRPRGSHAWENAVKRVEDSVRMTTFMGSLHKGMDPREAAANASKIHFDYGDLTSAEKNFMRRLMPFYTFTSRNLPLQVAGILGHPGKYAAVAHLRDEGRQQSGLPLGFESGQSPYEMRQGGIPFKFGGKQFTLSVGSPFVDLNETASAFANENPLKGLAAGGQKVAELSSPILKSPIELAANYSFFYRDQIQHESEPLTRAPAWAQGLAKTIPGFAKATGYVPDYVPPEGGKTPGWGRKADYAFRQLSPGPIGPLIDLVGGGVQGANARAMTPKQRALATFGPRAIEYKANQARINRIYNRLDEISAKTTVLRRRAHPRDKTPDGKPYRINAEHPTPAFTKLAKEESRLQEELRGRVSQERPGGFVGGEAVPLKKGKAAKGRLPVDRGRLPVDRGRLPVAGGRLPVVR